jgi:hypothetical protein
MITEDQYKHAIEQKELAEKIINEFHEQKRDLFKERMQNDPVFTDDELRYAATSRCPCGHGLAYPKDCGPDHYWDCSAILKGVAVESVAHTAHLFFMYHSIKSESDHYGTTRA